MCSGFHIILEQFLSIDECNEFFCKREPMQQHGCTKQQCIGIIKDYAVTPNSIVHVFFAAPNAEKMLPWRSISMVFNGVRVPRKMGRQEFYLGWIPLSARTSPERKWAVYNLQQEPPASFSRRKSRNKAQKP